MKISHCTYTTQKRFGLNKTLEMMTEAGFEAYDCSFFDMTKDDFWANQPDCYEKANELRKLADKLGIECNQAHAPFPTGLEDAAAEKARFERVVRSMELSAILGAKIIVIHPKTHLYYYDEGIPEKLREMNKEFYKALLPYSYKFGIKIGVENMFGRHKSTGLIDHHCCSRPQEFRQYLDDNNDPNLVACLDLGHSPIVKVDYEEMINTLGSSLQALHIHDNDMVNDNHILPFFGKNDYEHILDLLKNAGYKGDITFESHQFGKNLPDELYIESLKMTVKVGEYIRKRLQ